MSKVLLKDMESTVAFEPAHPKWISLAEALQIFDIQSEYAGPENGFAGASLEAIELHNSYCEKVNAWFTAVGASGQLRFIGKSSKRKSAIPTSYFCWPRTFNSDGSIDPQSYSKTCSMEDYAAARRHETWTAVCVRHNQFTALLKKSPPL